MIPKVDPDGFLGKISTPELLKISTLEFRNTTTLVYFGNFFGTKFDFLVVGIRRKISLFPHLWIRPCPMLGISIIAETLDLAIED